jgi:hypothetical protein
MPVEERQRIALHHQIVAAWGEEAADTLFELIAPAGHELATRQDLDRGFERVDGRFASLEAQIDHRFAESEQRIDHRFAESEQRIDHRFTESEQRIDHRFTEFEHRIDQRFTELDGRFAALDARFAALGERFERRIADAVTTQTRTLVLSQLGALIVIAGLAFGLQ